MAEWQKEVAMTLQSRIVTVALAPVASAEAGSSLVKMVPHYKKKIPISDADDAKSTRSGESCPKYSQPD